MFYQIDILLRRDDDVEISKKVAFRIIVGLQNKILGYVFRYKVFKITFEELHFWLDLKKIYCDHTLQNCQNECDIYYLYHNISEIS